MRPISNYGDGTDGRPTYKLYYRANTADLARWQRTLGRQFVTTVKAVADLLRRHNISIDDLAAEAPPNDHSDPDADIDADFDPTTLTATTKRPPSYGLPLAEASHHLKRLPRSGLPRLRSSTSRWSPLRLVPCYNLNVRSPLLSPSMHRNQGTKSKL